MRLNIVLLLIMGMALTVANCNSSSCVDDDRYSIIYRAWKIYSQEGVGVAEDEVLFLKDPQDGRCTYHGSMEGRPGFSGFWNIREGKLKIYEVNGNPFEGIWEIQIEKDTDIYIRNGGELLLLESK